MATRHGQAPLFPGYLFFRLSAHGNSKLVTTPGVISVVAFGGVWVTLDDNEINALQLIITSPVLREPWRYVPVGCRVRVDSGPLKGLSGVLVTNGNKLVVSVTILQRSVAVSLDESTLLTPLPNSPERDAAPSDSARLAFLLCSNG
jgi:transcription antitermination factor NusG